MLKVNEVPLFHYSAIESRITSLSKEIYNSYTKEECDDLVIIVNLKGAFIFASDLYRKLNINCSIDFIRTKSYQSTESIGKIKLELDISESINNKNVLIIEDIVDTGLTIKYLKEYLLNDKKAKNVKVCTLLNKPSRRQCNIELDFIGFEIEDKFVIGYGLDYNDFYRNLPSIYYVIR